VAEGTSGFADAYDDETYEFIADTARPAAEIVVPLLLEHTRPRSVIDYGCGTGDWLAVCLEHGVHEVLGVDGTWLDQRQLKIASRDFRVHDLREPFTPPHGFDLAICLEVVGHIAPADEDVFLDSLAALAPVVLFSAPIPHQPGIGDQPLNNRWPAHWAERLRQRGFVAIDCLRPRLWEDQRVVWWYAQNLWVAVRETALGGLPSLQRLYDAAPRTPLPLVHPGMVEELLAELGADDESG
jgi:SAM-dependent methyltransferase